MRARLRHPLIPVALALSLGGTVSACGDDDEKEAGAPQTQTATQPKQPAQLDVAKLEKSIRQTLSGPTLSPTINGQQTKGKKTVTSVSCPDEIQRRKGETVVCDVEAVDKGDVAGTVQQSGTIRLTQEDDRGSVLGYKASLKGGPIKTTQSGKLKLD
jgi:hypothetical protein